MDYTLTISTVIQSDDYDDSIEASYPCSYSCENGIHRLKYNDPEAGFTVVRISPDGSIEIRRRQSFTIIMREGYVHSVDCETPYGSIPMQFALMNASHSLHENGGTLAYAAKVHIDGQPQINTVTMRLSPATHSQERKDEIQ